MKKQITGKKAISAVLLTILITAATLTGCKKEPVPEAHLLGVDSSGVTGSGVQIGSTYDEWAEAYGDYHVQILNGETFEPYVFPEKEESAEPVSHDGAYLVAAFYVDDEPKSVEDLVKETGVSAEELADYLAGPEYLAEHNVVYRYAIFTIKDDTVTDIDADYLDYAQEL